MSTPILATKLYVPSPRPGVVLRPRLIARLNAGLVQNQRFGRKLTLISAPAGFGKTTLLSEWIEGYASDVHIAYLSLDEGDSNLASFLHYFIAALRMVMPNIGMEALATLRSAQQLPMDVMLTDLLNDIAGYPDNVILVLDDYHVIDADPIDQALTFLIEHLPPQMHLVIASREDPGLPLPRLRAKNQLTELRAADLRFTTSEAAEFLNHGMGLKLTADAIAALENRTEGWIAGLQLAALSMQGQTNTGSFLQAFTGSHPFVFDYLTEEVLQRQPETVRDFMVQTSVLSTLSGPLCDAVTGRQDSREMLALLERSNLFVVPLDNQRQWYRYHHLFADALRERLLADPRYDRSTLHQRASAWYEQNNRPADAIRHAFAAEDLARTADLLEIAWPSMEESFQSAVWFDWVKAVPNRLIRNRPVLSVSYAYALLGYGDFDAADARLKDAERWLDTESDEMVVVDKAQFLALPATIAIARAYCAQALGDVSAAVKYASQILNLVPEGHDIRHIQATSLLGLTYWATGNLEAAYQTFADYIRRLRSAGDLAHAISPAFVLADIRMAQGYLHEATATLNQLLQLVLEQGEPLPPDTAELYRGLSELHREQGDLQTAAQYLNRSKALISQSTLLDRQRRLHLADAQLKLAQGDQHAALDLLDKAEACFIRTPLPDVRPIPARRARIWITRGRLDRASMWASENHLQSDDHLTYLREFEHITLARLLLARCKTNRINNAGYEAIRLLNRLLQAAEARAQIASMIEILVLLALVYEAQGNLDLALKPLERALALAEPEGFVRVFVDEGQPMVTLLSQGITPDYTKRLLAYFATAQAKPTEESPALIETLTPREQSVLQLLAAGRSNPEIAAELVISVTTVKTHVKNIYEKLQVANRVQAIARANELNLL